ncbi:MAG TPA: sugar ABC transporter substrate-binding protein [Candidatus Pelethocola excrementipullorum]|nr:sugar ABC transporter substrate-binding protein [Candidatus Pelethocola excrementipullorum]
MKRKLLSVLLAATTMAMLLAGCSKTPSGGGGTSAESENSTEVEESDDAKIGFLAPNLQNEFFIGIDNGLKEGCAEKGWEYVSVSFDNDSAAAVSAIENLVTGQCDVIIAMVSDDSCDSALKAAQSEGVKIMECGVETEVYDVCLNTDQRGIGVEIGTMASDWINTQLQGAGKVVVYTTYQNQDMQDRGEGIQEALKEKAKDAKVLEVVDIGKDVVGSGTSTTENMLQKYADLNTIVCYGDAAAVEAMEAVKAAGLNTDDFGIFACDGTEQAFSAIAKNDVMRGTVVFDPLPPLMIEYCERVLGGEEFPEVIATGTNNVTSANIKEFYTSE